MLVIDLGKQLYLASMLRCFILFLFLELSLCAEHIISIEPQAYWVKRTREGGSRQTGWLGGFKADYDRISPGRLYWGGHVDWAKGSLTGKNGGGFTIKSTLTDYEAEARAGFTFHTHARCCLSFTPFVAWGLYQAKNDFKDPSPLLVIFKDSYEYAAGGFIFRFNRADCWTGGINFSAKYMLDGKSKLTDKELETSQTLSVGEKWQYEVELPVFWRTYCKCVQAHVGIVPFWKLRQFGGTENFPFDFRETKYVNWGARLEGAIYF